MSEMITAAPMASNRGHRKTKIGKVVSHKMQKSIVVSVERQVRHSLYGKYVKKTTKFMAHDENNDAKEGDKVLIVETRPLSKRKRWRLAEVLERAK
jgi:small subunit ribosomal protein S17